MKHYEEPMAMTPRCLLCDRIVTDEVYERLELTSAALDLFNRSFPTTDPELFAAQNVLCGTCKALPKMERQKLAKKALEREMREVERDLGGDN